MKKSVLLIPMAILMVTGNAMAADLSGTWLADNWCVPNDKPGFDPLVPKYEESEVVITQEGDFFITSNIVPTPGEECGGVIDGKDIYMTCPGMSGGTIFHGKLIGKNKIVGINQNPGDGATCKVEAFRQ